MKLFNNINEIDKIEPTAIALGNFDGVHKGHIELIRRTVESAKETGIKSAVFTFSNHPKNFMTGSNAVKNIISSEDKIAIIGEIGVDYVFSIPFDESIHLMEHKDFINKLILDKMNAKIVYCGFNYHYGKNAEGSSKTLIQSAESEGFEINILEPYIVNNNLVSSTLIRSLIAKGKFHECTDYLGRHYFTQGTVTTGNQIGRTIGFPTSNIIIDESMVWPSHGVYITNCYFDGVKYHAVTNVGIRPTIGDNHKVVETHLFDFDQYIYENNIKVEFLEKIRDERKFASKEELKERISLDKQIAGEYHMKNQ